MTGPFDLHVGRRQESRTAIDRAATWCRRALESVFADVVAMADHMLPGSTDRLVVFRVAPGVDQPRLMSVELYGSLGQHVIALSRLSGPSAATLTSLHADVVVAVSRWAEQECPPGIAAAIDDSSLVGYPAGHCSHWTGAPDLAIELDHGVIPPPSPPRCCPAHTVGALLERYDVTPPTQEVESECD